MQLPVGAGPVSASLVANGLATYAFLALSNRWLEAADYDALAVVWAATYTIGPGLFQPIEQELSRSVSDRRARGRPYGDLVVKGSAVALTVSGLVAVLLGVGWSLGLIDFLGPGAAPVALMVAVAGFACSEVVRGVLAGSDAFGGFALYIAAEGIVRLVLLLALGVVGGTTGNRAMFAFAIGFAASSVIALVGRSFPIDRSDSSTWSPFIGRLSLLSVSAVGEAFVLNIGPVVVSQMGTGLSGAYLNTLVIARIPVFFFQAIKVALLPHLAAEAARGDLESVRRSLRSVSAFIAGLGGAGVLAAGAIGPPIVEAVFGDRPRVLDMVLLAGATAGLMFVITFTVTLISLQQAGRTALSWLVSLAVFVTVLSVDADPRTRVGLALVAMVLVSSALQGSSLWRRLHVQVR